MSAGFSLPLQIRVKLAQTHILCFVAAENVSTCFSRHPWHLLVVVVMSGLLLPLKRVNFWVPLHSVSSQLPLCWIIHWIQPNSVIATKTTHWQDTFSWMRLKKVTGTVCITKMPFHIEYWTSPLGTGHLWLHHTLAAPALGSCLAILFFLALLSPHFWLLQGALGSFYFILQTWLQTLRGRPHPINMGNRSKAFGSPTRAGSGGNKKHLLLSTFCGGI